MTDFGACKNTDREIYRTPHGSMYEDSIHVTQAGSIGINVSGHVIVKPLRDWHALATPSRPVTAGAFPSPLEAAKKLLISAAGGSCTCHTKSPELIWHMPDCRYVVIMSALENVEIALGSTVSPQDGVAEANAVADQMIGQIEDRFPNWRSYRDLIDCIDCTLHDLRTVASKGAA